MDRNKLIELLKANEKHIPFDTKDILNQFINEKCPINYFSVKEDNTYINGAIISDNTAINFSLNKNSEYIRLYNKEALKYCRDVLDEYLPNRYVVNKIPHNLHDNFERYLDLLSSNYYHFEEDTLVLEVEYFDIELISLHIEVIGSFIKFEYKRE